MARDDDWLGRFSIVFQKLIRTVIRSKAQLTPEDEEEVFQDICLRVVELAYRLPSSDKAPWLSAIARNVTWEFLRSLKKDPRWSEEISEEIEVPVRQYSLETEHRRDELLSSLQTAIQDLPGKLRDAFVLIGIEGLKTSEASQILQCGRTTVWDRFRRAEVELHRSLNLGIVEGAVRGDGGGAISKATVQIRGIHLPFSNKAGASRGTFRFAYLKPSEYILSAQAPSFRSAKTEIRVRPGRPVTVELNLAPEQEGL